MYLRRTLRTLIALPFLAAIGLGFLMLPGARRLPSYRRRSLEDVVQVREQDPLGFLETPHGDGFARDACNDVERARCPRGFGAPCV